jgi:hypothetical protein
MALKSIDLLIQEYMRMLLSLALLILLIILRCSTALFGLWVAERRSSILFVFSFIVYLRLNCCLSVFSSTWKFSFFFAQWFMSLLWEPIHSWHVWRLGLWVEWGSPRVNPSYYFLKYTGKTSRILKN